MCSLHSLQFCTARRLQFYVRSLRLVNISLLLVVVVCQAGRLLHSSCHTETPVVAFSSGQPRPEAGEDGGRKVKAAVGMVCWFVTGVLSGIHWFNTVQKERGINMENMICHFKTDELSPSEIYEVLKMPDVFRDITDTQ